jgi:hypothetical protein
MILSQGLPGCSCGSHIDRKAFGFQNPDGIGAEVSRDHRIQLLMGQELGRADAGPRGFLGCFVWESIHVERFGVHNEKHGTTTEALICRVF